MFNIKNSAVIVAAALAVLVANPGQARAADSFVNPFVGFNFGGDAGCPSISNCEDKKLNAGVSLGTMGALFGFEEEFAYAKNFFGDAPGLDSSVLTVMSNAMLVPNVGPIRPYALVGLGLIKTHVSLTPSSVLTSDNNSLGWDIGGGVNIFFSNHAGVRGDVRYFHSFQDLNLLGLSLSDTKLDFGRASVGIIFKF